MKVIVNKNRPNSVEPVSEVADVTEDQSGYFCYSTGEHFVGGFKTIGELVDEVIGYLHEYPLGVAEAPKITYGVFEDRADLVVDGEAILDQISEATADTHGLDEHICEFMPTVNNIAALEKDIENLVTDYLNQYSFNYYNVRELTALEQVQIDSELLKRWEASQPADENEDSQEENNNE